MSSIQGRPVNRYGSIIRKESDDVEIETSLSSSSENPLYVENAVVL